MPVFDTVENHHVIQFSNKLHVLAQQMEAKFRPWVDIVQVTGEKFMYDRIGSLEAREVNGRYQQVQFDDINMSRRALLTTPIVVTVGVDEKDVLRLLQDPSSRLIQACMAAMQRKFDRIVSAAAFADVYTGKNGDTAVTFANDGGRTVTATAGLTYEKLLSLIENRIDDDVDSKEMGLFIAGKEHTALMNEQQLTSGDYSREFAVDKGMIQRAAGLNVQTFSANATLPVLDVTSGVRSCIAMVKGAMVVGMQKEFSVKIEDRPDLHFTKQIKVSGILGAARTEGKRIQKVTTTA